MKQNIILTEQDIRKIVTETIDEINSRPQSKFSNIAGLGPGFKYNNPRHINAYDNVMDSVMYVKNKWKLRNDVIKSMLMSIMDDIDYVEQE